MNIGFDIDDTITNSSEIFVKYAIEYKLNGFNVINDFNRIVKENYRKQRREKFITIKIKFKDLDYVINLLNNNNIFVERVVKNKWVI